MNPHKEHWKKSPWTISIATAIFSLMLTIGYDYLKEKPILTTILTILKWFKDLGWEILNFDLKIWWIIFALLLVILTIVFIKKLKSKEIPTFCNYRVDKFKRWRWTWDWQWEQQKKTWSISNIKAHCPNCNTPLLDHSISIYDLAFDCPRCDFKARKEQCDEPHKIVKIILDNIDRNSK